MTGAFFDEVLGTALLCIAVLTINQGARAKFPIHLRAVALMWAFIGVSGAVGIQTSFGLNPARDLGPRIAAAMFRYPSTIWTDRQGYFFYGAVLGPVAGALLGAGFWEILLGEGVKVRLRRKH
jgi:aquaglyceroporin related protein